MWSTIGYPIYFEDEIKEEKSIVAMDEEITTIEKNDVLGIAKSSIRKGCNWCKVGI